MARRGKYRNATKRSGFEDKVAAYLTEQGVKFGYETLEIRYLKYARFEAVVDSKKQVVDVGDASKLWVATSHVYTPDFILDNGLIIEAKGNFKPADRSKMLAIKKQHPDLRIALLFMRNNRLPLKTAGNYLDWAEVHGYTAAVNARGEVPATWLT